VFEIANCTHIIIGCTEQFLAWRRHTDFMEAGDRPLIVAKSWRCSWPDSASHSISNCRLKSITGVSYQLMEEKKNLF